MNRRAFLKGLGLTALAALAPQLALARSISFSGRRRILIMVELQGGIDGLNTLVPYTNPAYYAARPTLALDQNTLAAVEGEVAMHPMLQPLSAVWETGELGWIQGVGYENASHSHFESKEVWDSASFDQRQPYDGWIAQCFPEFELGGIAVDTNLGPLCGGQFAALSISDPHRFVDTDAKAVDRKNNSEKTENAALQHVLQVHSEIDMRADALVDYLHDMPQAQQAFANNDFERSLQTVYTLIASGINVPAYKVSLSGFDTHVAQATQHAVLLDQLANGFAKLRTNLQHIDMWNEVVVMTYSEFGRSLRENKQQGTDHGTAAAHMVLGGRIRGGLYGESPSLTELDKQGNMYHTTDFWDLYATIRDDWWQLDKTGQGRSLGFV